MKLIYFLYFSVIILSCIVILVGYGHIRTIDGDEGYYTTAARLVAEGNVPYRDFFYMQAPLLPYVYSLPTLLTGHSLMALRMLSVVCGVLTVILWAIFLWKEYSRTPSVAIVALIVLVLNPYLISWGVTVKTYALSNLLITCFFISLYFAIRSGKSIWYLCAGLSLGFCVSIRLLYAPIIGLVVLWIIIESIKTRHDFSKYSHVAMLFAGIILSLLPAIIIYLICPKAFVFNNIGYHNLRSSRPSNLYNVIFAVYFLMDTVVYSPYLLLQCSLAFTGAYTIFKANKDIFIAKQNITYVKLILGITIVFILSSMIPVPLYKQYFTAPHAPFLLPIVAVGLLTISKKSSRFMFVICLFAVLLSMLQVFREVREHSQKKVWYLSSYHEVSKYVEQNTTANDIVLSFWPGYVYESSRQYFPGLENHFALRVSSKISALERDSYHIPCKDKIFAAILDKSPKIVITGAWMKDFYRNLKDSEKKHFQEILEANYNLAKKVGGVKIYRR